MGDQELIQEIVGLSKVYYNRQWMFATAGNLSIRSVTNPSQIWITASGKDKGNLNLTDFVCVDIFTSEIVKNSLQTLPNESDSPLHNATKNKPSAETSIHQAVYQFSSTISAVLHVHTLSSNLLVYSVSSQEKFKLVDIPNIEIIKAYGIWNENPNLKMAVFYNFGNVKDIAESIQLFFAENPDYMLPFILVEGHGPTVWGNSILEANRHLEATAFLFDVMKESLR